MEKRVVIFKDVIVDGIDLLELMQRDEGLLGLNKFGGITPSKEVAYEYSKIVGQNLLSMGYFKCVGVTVNSHNKLDVHISLLPICEDINVKDYEIIPIVNKDYVCIERYLLYKK